MAYDFCWKFNSISYLFRESWNLGNFNDCNTLSKSADARAMARAWLISSVTGTFRGPQDSREEPWLALLLYPEVFLNLPVNKPEDIVCVLIKRQVLITNKQLELLRFMHPCFGWWSRIRTLKQRQLRQDNWMFTLFTTEGVDRMVVVWRGPS